MPEPNAAVTTDTEEEGNGAGNEPLSYKDWVGEQPDNVKTMLSSWEGGLKSALQSERTRAKDLEKQVRDASKKLEEGSDARVQLESLADSLALAKQESAFYELAHAAGANNIKLLYIAATQDKSVHADGSADFVQLKTVYPQLFGSTKPVPKANAGDGSGDPPSGKKDMNNFLRAAAGRKI